MHDTGWVNPVVAAQACEAFGWAREDVVITPGPRGALGQIWRVEIGHAVYALKEIFANPPAEALIAAELDFSKRAVEAGVHLPASHPDRQGQHLVTTPDGTWLRLYDWMDLRPLDPTEPRTPQELGALLARLHRSSPAATHEPGGQPPDPWYDHAPALHTWTQPTLPSSPQEAGSVRVAWAGRLADRVDTLPELCSAVTPADPATLIVCHRDLHPENVLQDRSGGLVVVDWDNLGPAAPGRELARALFDWFCDRSAADLDAVRAMYGAYVEEGGQGRITELADFTMLIASRLNFLQGQIRIALDPAAERRHRDWAEREIDEALDILPTPRQLADVLALTTTTR